MFSDLGFSDQTMYLFFKRSLKIVIEGSSLAVVKKGSFSKIVFKNCRFLKMIPGCTALYCSTVKLRAKKISFQNCIALRTKIVVLFRLFWRHYAIHLYNKQLYHMLIMQTGKIYETFLNILQIFRVYYHLFFEAVRV